VLTKLALTQSLFSQIMFLFCCVAGLSVSFTLMTFCATRWHCKRGKWERKSLL